MKFFITVITCLLCLQIFAQDVDHMQMNMPGDNYLPKIIRNSLIKSWGYNNLFKTQLDPSSLVYIKGEQEHTITIKAFQQKFYDDPKVLKPVWVLGYVAKESSKQPALPGPVIIAEYAHPTKIFWVNKVYETLRKQTDYKLYPTYDTQTKAHPFVPVIYNVNDPLHISMIADVLYPDFRKFQNGIDAAHEKYMDMSTYYSTTVHLHGGNVTWQNDGYPTSKYYPKPGAAAINITWGLFGKFEENKTGQHYFYPNTLPEGERSIIKSKMQNTPLALGDEIKYEGHHGAILWYHDHAMMRTATDIYSGMAGAYIINGEDEKTFSSLVKYKCDLPLMLSDKSFTESNYLYYNTTSTKFSVDKTPESEGQPEFLGNTITVNGKIWPYMNVEKNLYRFRIINASTTRFYRVALAKWKNGKIDTTNNAKLSKNFIQVGTEGGFIPDGKFPHIGNDSSALTLAPAERADVLINFSAFEPGTSLVLLNYAPDAPFGNDELMQMNGDNNFDDLTNYIMLFRINKNSVAADVTEINLNDALRNFSSSSIYKQTTSSQRLFSYFNTNNKFVTDLQKILTAKFVSDAQQRKNVNENAFASVFPNETDLFSNVDVFKLNIREAANYQQLPTPYKKFLEQDPMLKNDLAFPMSFLNETEWNVEAHNGDTSKKNQYEKIVNNYSTEIWAIWNSTDDAHPIHIHLNRFRILGRQKADNAGNPLPGAENFILPEPNETGWKDVVRAKPGYINYLLIQYIQYDGSQEGQFLYHCHIAEHEDMGMMRRLVIKPDNNPQKIIIAAH